MNIRNAKVIISEGTSIEWVRSMTAG